MIKPYHLYSTKDGEYVVLVTDVKDDTVIKDIQVEYYILDYKCFSSIKFFEDNFKEAEYEY